MIALTNEIFAASMTAKTEMTDAILDVISLETYLGWMRLRDDEKEAQGWWVGRLTEDPADWAEIEVYTAWDLANYLDECVENERRKDDQA